MVQKQDMAYLMDEVKDIYKEIHQHPEIGFEEFETSRLISEKLKEYNIESQTVMLTGVIGTIHGSKPGKTVALRADIDALPFSEKADLPYASKISERMHACGHDAHTAMLLGAARYLSEHRDQFSGSVRLIFQPAEEGWSLEGLKQAVAVGASEQGGAASMIKAGALEGVDMCFALHIDSINKMGTLTCCRGPAYAACDRYELTILGKGGHAASPHNAIDPIPAAVGITRAYHALPAREFSALETCLVSVGSINTDSAANSIADKVRISGTVRTFNEEIRETIIRRMMELAEHISTAHRCKAEFLRIRESNPTINSLEAADFMMDVAGKMLGRDNVKVKTPSMGSEDVGCYFQVVPGAMVNFGTAKDGEEIVSLHNPHFKLNLDALEIGVRLNINIALNFLHI